MTALEEEIIWTSACDTLKNSGVRNFAASSKILPVIRPVKALLQ